MKKNVLKKFAAAALAAATVMSSMSVMAFADDTGATAKQVVLRLRSVKVQRMDMKRLTQIMEQLKMCQQKKS